jgi:hypothetical protein
MAANLNIEDGQSRACTVWESGTIPVVLTVGTGQVLSGISSPNQTLIVGNVGGVVTVDISYTHPATYSVAMAFGPGPIYLGGQANSLGNNTNAQPSLVSGFYDNAETLGWFATEDFDSLIIGMTNKSSSTANGFPGTTNVAMLIGGAGGALYTSGHTYVPGITDPAGRTTLDDGSGNMVVAGSLTVDGNVSMLGGAAVASSLIVNSGVAAASWVLGQEGPTYAGIQNASLGSVSGSNSYAMLQDSSGNTFVNAASGKNVFMRINNSTILQLGSGGATVTGTLSASAWSGVLTGLSAGTGISISGSGNVLTITNTGLSALTAGTGINVSGSQVSINQAASLTWTPNESFASTITLSGTIYPSLVFMNTSTRTSAAQIIAGMAGTTLEFLDNVSGNAVAAVLAAAAATNTGYQLSIGSINVGSDSHLKPDFQPYGGNVLAELKGVRFGMHRQWIKPDGSTWTMDEFHPAVAADTLPDGVRSKSYRHGSKDVKDPIYGVSFPGYTHWIVGILKAQQEVIEKLEARIAKLEET